MDYKKKEQTDRQKQKDEAQQVLQENLKKLGLIDNLNGSLGKILLSKAFADYISLMKTMKTTTEFMQQQSTINKATMTETVIQKFILLSILHYIPKEMRETMTISINSLEDEKYHKDVIQNWTDALYSLEDGNTDSDERIWN